MDGQAGLVGQMGCSQASPDRAPAAMAWMGGAGRSGAAGRELAGHHRTGGAGAGPAVVSGGLLCDVVGRKKISKETQG